MNILKMKLRKYSICNCTKKYKILRNKFNKKAQDLYNENNRERN